MTHQANDNLMAAVVECFTGTVSRRSAGGPQAPHRPVQGVSYIDDNTRCAEGDFNVIAGTPWLHASRAIRDHPVDVLVIDEAGQIGLADAIAASISATNVILLGDPQQLPQVAQARHPHGSGASALEHMLHGAPTISPDRGVFLDTTRRMHSRRQRVRLRRDVRRSRPRPPFLRCADHAGGHRPALAARRTRRLRHEFGGRGTRIAEYLRPLIDTPWTDQHGESTLLRPADFMVVAPYNDQVRPIRQALSSNKRTAKIEVGTVDRFQGREAAVVLFSMTTSSAEYMPRTADFLFSRNRLNVAISRARCLAVLVCTDKLLATRADTVEEMKMIGALCSFVERATPA